MPSPDDRPGAERTSAVGQHGGNAHATTSDDPSTLSPHERLREAEQRLTELCYQAERVRRKLVSKAEVDSALEALTPLWDALSPREQARVLRLLIQRVDHDGAKTRGVLRSA